MCVCNYVIKFILLLFDFLCNLSRYEAKLNKENNEKFTKVFCLLAILFSEN